MVMEGEHCYERAISCDIHVRTSDGQVINTSLLCLSIIYARFSSRYL